MTSCHLRSILCEGGLTLPQFAVAKSRRSVVLSCEAVLRDNF